MRYPTLSRTKCADIAENWLRGGDRSIDHEVEWLGVGRDADLRGLENLASQMTAETRHWTDSDKDRFEGSACGWLFSEMSQFPTEILDDRGLWRFLAIRYFWDFIAWRESGPFDAGNHLKYIDASNPSENVLTRMYLRAQALGGADAGVLASSIPHAVDFWRSHVIRVKTGSAIPVARAFALRQSQERLNTDQIRDAARRMTRLWTNLVLYLYDEDEAEEVVREVWETVSPQ